MKLTVFLLLVCLPLFIYSQEIDSLWIANTYANKFIKDTGIYLSEESFIDEKGQSRKLSEYKGKIVYIDVWTTWCGPCLASFPHSEQLYKRLKFLHLDTVIQLINICTEDSRSEWKKKLRHRKPVGLNLYSSDTSLYKSWNIRSFPRYILLDTSGKVICFDFISPDNSPIDYLLYAAAKGIKPGESIWTYFRQSQYHQKHQNFTNDDEGVQYAAWFNSIRDELIKYFKWKQQIRK